jgi:hypothetical protein
VVFPEPEQCGLTRTGGADDGDAFAAAHANVRTAQYLQRYAALHELFHEVHALEHGIR